MQPSEIRTAYKENTFTQLTFEFLAKFFYLKLNERNLLEKLIEIPMRESSLIALILQ